MSTVNKNQIIRIKKYYNSGLSVREISVKLGVSIDAVYYFFRKYNIKRRNQSEARKACYTRKEPSFKIKKNLTNKEKELKVAGIMLYWGEGSKWPGEKIVDFANSSPGMVKIFLKFLRVVCGIGEEKLRVYLYCYGNQDIGKLTRHWSHITGISRKQFTKPYVRNDYRKNKKGKMKYGLIHVRYNDKKLLLKIKEWIDSYEDYSL